MELLILGLGGDEVIFLFAVCICAVLFSGILFVIPLWQIAKKMGVSPSISLFAFLPTIGLVLVLFILAFSSNKKSI